MSIDTGNVVNGVVLTKYYQKCANAKET